MVFSQQTPQFDIVIEDIVVLNIGKNYKLGDKITITDKDKDTENGEARLVVEDGRIVDVEIINSGTGFQSIPEIEIESESGFGADIVVSLGLIPKNSKEYKPQNKAIEMIFCPGKNRKNLI